MTPAGRRYRILQTLGRGGFGTVYRAELLAPGGFSKIVALKVLNASGEASDDMALRLRDEARMLGLLKHRAIVGVDYLAPLADGWTVVMEYVAGVDVSRLKEVPDLPVRVALEIVEEVASALHAAFTATHERTGEPLRLVHRDIKPSNVRVTPQGEVKVLDFGVARAEFATREAVTRSMTFGSYRYMAPERLEGDDTHAGDVYALGIVALELLIGRASLDLPPRIERRWSPWLRNQLRVIEARMRQAGAHDQAVQALIALLPRMVALAPEDRPDAREVQRTIRDWLGRMEGPWLRGWAEEAITALADEDAVGAPDPESGHVLVEKAGSVAVLGVEADTAAVRTGRLWRPDTSSDNEATVVADTGARATERAEPRTLPIGRYAAAAGGVLSLVVVVLTLLVVALGLWSSEPAESATTGPLLDPAAAQAPTEPPAHADSDSTTAALGAADPARVAEETAPTTVDGHGKSTQELPRADASQAGSSVRSRASAAAPSPGPEPVQPAPAEPAGTPATGIVNVEGEDAAVTLVHPDGRRLTPGSPVPAATYAIEADFGQGAEPAGSLIVHPGDEVLLRCTPMFRRCAAR